ncbi:MAG TPA: hypothetical protein DIU42_08555 [Dermacoccus sp.]|nr:hypothetical protein [Dermacoccus sp.]
MLASLDSRVGLSAEDVALKAQLCPASGEVSGWTRRQVLRHLAHLQAHGLDQVSANAEWTRPQILPTLEGTSVEHQVVRERISLERLVFRGRVGVGAGASCVDRCVSGACAALVGGSGRG